MTNNEAIVVFYNLINKLYSINYSSLKVYEQGKAHSSPEKFRFKDFQSPQEFIMNQTNFSWLDSKMSDLNELRESFFENYTQANSKNVEHFKIINEELESSKETLRFMYNIWFDKQDSFEDIFDGFVCKSPELLKLISMTEMQPCVIKNPAISQILAVYSIYQSNLYYKTITQSVFDIIEQLSYDFNSNGTPSLYKGIIQNNDVVTISAKEIKNLRKLIDDLKAQIKSSKTKKHSGTAFTQNMALNKYSDANMFLEQIEKRLKSANTDAIDYLANKIVEGVMDFITGSTLEQKLVVDQIYVTKLELSYIEYLTEMMKHGIELLKENKKQESKEK